MDRVEQLRRLLGQVNEDRIRGFSVSGTSALDAQIKRIEQWIGHSAGGERPPQDHIRVAIDKFRQSGRLDTLRDARLVCFGCTEILDNPDERLIEHPSLFPRLLDQTDRFRENPRAFRRCYRGLLSGYFSYDPQTANAPPAGKVNWTKLRMYLEARRRDIEAPGTKPDWVSAIGKFENLLTVKPFADTRESLLSAGRDLLAELHQRLEIQDLSWVSRVVIETAIGQLAALSDREYKNEIPNILRFIDEHPIYVNRALTLTLERYAKCESRDVHDALREFAVGKWGNPWLSSTARNWGRVTEPTKAMIGSWLNLVLIEKFFSLLAEDGTNDQRRVKFWKRYHDQISEMYFAFGPVALRNRTEDFRKIRHEIGDRLLTLDNPGNANNNAFIMIMGNYAVVEFGVSGNACFVYRKDDLPFPLTGRVQGNTRQLKHPSHVDRLLHVDRSTGKWEVQFSEAIGRLTKTSSRARTTEGASARGPTKPDAATEPKAAGPKGKLDEASFRKFAGERHLRVDDRRDKGGNLWVFTGNTNLGINFELSQLGFTWSGKKQGWWKN